MYHKTKFFFSIALGVAVFSIILFVITFAVYQTTETDYLMEKYNNYIYQNEHSSTEVTPELAAVERKRKNCKIVMVVFAGSAILSSTALFCARKRLIR